jgi:hypothetical protein
MMLAGWTRPPGEGRLSAADFVTAEKAVQASRARDSFYWFRRLILEVLAAHHLSV